MHNNNNNDENTTTLITIMILVIIIAVSSEFCSVILNISGVYGVGKETDQCLLAIYMFISV